MTELSQRARSIIEEAKRADIPSAADKQRIREKLIARLGAGALVGGAVLGSSASGAASSAAGGGAGAASTTSASGGFGAVTGMVGAAGTGTAVGLTTKIMLVSSIIAAIGVGALTAPWDEITGSSNEKNGANVESSGKPTSQAGTSPAAKPQQSASDDSAAKAREADPLSLASDDEKRQTIHVDSSNNKTTPHLETEIKLLRAAQLALQKGNPKRALSMLNKHRRQFPDGLLRQEREAARAVALCELGRYDQGRQVAQRLLVNSPRSPLAQRIARSCNR